MAEQLKDTALARALSDVVGDLADLIQKEIRLARAEISEKISLKVRAGAWLSIAAVLALVALILVVQALVQALAAYGFAMHWACLMVALALGAVAGGAFAKGRADLSEEMTPDRTIYQVKRDVATVKEQLT